MSSHFLQDVPNVKYLIHAVTQLSRLAVAASQQIKGSKVTPKLRNQLRQRQCFQFRAAIAMKVQYCLICLVLWRVKEKPFDAFAVAIKY